MSEVEEVSKSSDAGKEGRNSESEGDSLDCPSDFKIRNLEGDYEDYYVIQDTLGEGTYGIVYQVTCKKDGKFYADKAISLEDDELGDIRKEIYFLQTSSHENIVKGFDSFYHENLLHIIMEQCEISLLDLMQILKRPFTEHEIAHIAYDTLKGLSYLHRMNRIHRDIKCGNLLLDSNGVIKLTDFGVSAQLSETVRKRDTIVGTAFWMAPEIILEEKYDVSCDIWSFGITLIELAQMKPPLYGTNPLRAFFLIPLRDPPVFKYPSKWSNEFNEFLSLCLRKVPTERASCEDLLHHPWINQHIRNTKIQSSSQQQQQQNVNRPMISLLEELNTIFESKGGRKLYFEWIRSEEKQKTIRKLKNYDDDNNESFNKDKSDGESSDDSVYPSDDSDYDDDEGCDTMYVRKKGSNNTMKRKDDTVIITDPDNFVETSKQENETQEVIRIFDTDDEEDFDEYITDSSDSSSSEYVSTDDESESDVDEDDSTDEDSEEEESEESEDESDDDSDEEEEEGLKEKEKPKKKKKEEVETKKKYDPKKRLKKRLFKVFYKLSEQNVIDLQQSDDDDELLKSEEEEGEGKDPKKRLKRKNSDIVISRRLRKMSILKKQKEEARKFMKKRKKSKKKKKKKGKKKGLFKILNIFKE